MTKNLSVFALACLSLAAVGCSGKDSGGFFGDLAGDARVVELDGAERSKYCNDLD